jgi:hypothetical protein
LNTGSQGVAPKPKAGDQQASPPWARVVGVSFGGATFIFFIVLAVSGFHPAAKFAVISVLALGLSLSLAFMGGSAAAKGKLPIPFLRDMPVEFSVAGGIAAFVIVLLFANWIYPAETGARQGPKLSGDADFQEILKARDPVVFPGSAPGPFSIARTYPDKSKYKDEGLFGQMLDGATSSFDFVVVTGHNLIGYRDAMERAVRRGVIVHGILFDADEAANPANCRAYGLAVKSECLKVQKESELQQDDLKALCRNTRNAKGRVAIRFYPNVPFNTMWIRDREEGRNSSASPVSLMRPHLYSNHDAWPSFVLSKDGEDLTNTLSKEFASLWEASKGKPEVCSDKW